jgi:thioredoxin reductase (NADPH)
VEAPDLYGAYPRLSGEQIERLATQGQRRATRAGDVLYREGDHQCDFYVILDGSVTIVTGYEGPDEQVLAEHGPGRFLGELGLLSGEVVFVTAVVTEDGAVLVLPVARLRELVAGDSALGDTILRAYLLRRAMLLELGAGLKIIGSRYSEDTRRLRELVARNRVPHRFIDLEEDASAEQLVRRLGVSPQDTPIVICPGYEVLRNPTNAELAQVIGLPARPPPDSVCDLLVVGAGPAGLAAAVYGASEGLATFACDAVATGGQASTSSRIENYLGFPSGISGAELAERAEIQAEKFGAMFGVPAEARSIERRNGHYVVRFEDEVVSARAVLIATGMRYRKLDVPRVEELEPTSIYYAATLVEAQICHGSPVAIVGGGNSAGQAAVFLGERGNRVSLVVRGNRLTEGMSRYLADRIERHPFIEVLLHTEVRELIGAGSLEAIVVEDVHTGDRRTLDVRYLFVFIGAEPRTSWLGDNLELDDRGFVLTRPGLSAQLPLETSWPGVFAAGDVRSGSVKRVASAVGEGAMAVQMVHQHFTRAF